MSDGNVPKVGWWLCSHLLPALGIFDLVRLDIEHDAAHLHRKLYSLWRGLETLHLLWEESAPVDRAPNAAETDFIDVIKSARRGAQRIRSHNRWCDRPLPLEADRYHYVHATPLKVAISAWVETTILGEKSLKTAATWNGSTLDAGQERAPRTKRYSNTELYIGHDSVFGESCSCPGVRRWRLCLLFFETNNEACLCRQTMLRFCHHLCRPQSVSGFTSSISAFLRELRHATADSSAGSARSRSL